MKLKTRILISLGVAPLVYIGIAVLLALLPVKRNPPARGLDFDALQADFTEKVSARENFYEARDGGKLFYRFITGARHDVILVLLHGSGSEGRYLLEPAQKLATTAGICVVVPDLRGHGRSALGKMGDIDYLGQYADDLEDLLIHLKNTYPHSLMLLGGHSSGGGLALKYAGGNHIPYDGYVLLAPYLGYKAPTVRKNSGGWIQVALRRYIGLGMLNNLGITLFNGLPVIYFNRPSEWNDSLQTESYSYRLSESFSPQDYARDLQRNKKPLLVLEGSDDEAFYPDKFKPIFDQYAPSANFQMITGAKHLDLPGNQQTILTISTWVDSIYHAQMQFLSGPSPGLPH